MNIALTSDWHEQLPIEYPPCDVIIHAGDIGEGPLVANMRTPVVWNVSSVDERYQPRVERFTIVEW